VRGTACGGARCIISIIILRGDVMMMVRRRVTGTAPHTSWRSCAACQHVHFLPFVSSYVWCILTRRGRLAYMLQCSCREAVIILMQPLCPHGPAMTRALFALRFKMHLPAAAAVLGTY
jgi:hypothetical protein